MKCGQGTDPKSPDTTDAGLSLKVGEAMSRAYLGTQLLGKYVAEDYFAEWFYISLVGELYGLTTSDSLYVKDIRVSYEEGVILH